MWIIGLVAAEKTVQGLQPLEALTPAPGVNALPERPNYQPYKELIQWTSA